MVVSAAVSSPPSDSTLRKRGPAKGARASSGDDAAASAVAELDVTKYWMIGGKLYDLTDFVERHPGGKQTILLGRGTDCTYLFESVHFWDKRPKSILAKYYVADAPGANAAGEGPYTLREDGFYRTLKRRLQAHFKGLAEKQSYQTATRIHHGTAWYHVAVALLYIGVMYCYYKGLYGGSFFYSALAGILGFAVGGVGHEALHYGTFSSLWFNRALCFLSMDALGLASFIWFSVHCCSHHIYTNVVGVDPDVMVHFPITREFQFLPRRFYHALQPLYTIMLKNTVSLFGLPAIDVAAMLVRTWGNPDYPTPIAQPLMYEAVLFWVFKALYLAAFYLGPYMVLGATHPYSWFLYPATLTASASWLVITTFALNHQNTRCMSDEEALVDYVRNPPRGADTQFPDWGAVQVKTTADIQHSNFWLSFPFLFSFGGLSYQIEHHLFPTISIAHMHHVAPIVEATAKEFGLPYHHFPTYIHAVVDHVRFLHDMGTKDRPFESHQHTNAPGPQPRTHEGADRAVYSMLLKHHPGMWG